VKLLSLPPSLLPFFFGRGACANLGPNKQRRLGSYPGFILCKGTLCDKRETHGAACRIFRRCRRIRFTCRVARIARLSTRGMASGKRSSMAQSLVQEDYTRMTALAGPVLPKRCAEEFPPWAGRLPLAASGRLPLGLRRDSVTPRCKMRLLCTRPTFVRC
jgi:hypothetical protein